VEVNMISLDQLNSLFKDSHEIERLGRLLTLQMLTLINDKLLSLQFKTAKERYVSMLHLHPDIFNRVSLGHISSYIGITPQSLSRIRTEL
jgi:CRP-like cAMP-binding protein